MDRLGVSDGFAYRQLIQNCPDKVIKEMRRVNLCTNFDKNDGAGCQCVLCQQVRSAMAPDSSFVSFPMPT